MFGINLDLSDLEKESKQQVSEFENSLKSLRIENAELEPQLTTYLMQIGDGFEELSFEEPAIIPDVFLREFDNLA